MTKYPPKHARPFAQAGDFRKWVMANCHRCTKGFRVKPACTIQVSLTAAYLGDGYVSTEIVDRMGSGDICLEREDNGEG